MCGPTSWLCCLCFILALKEEFCGQLLHALVGLTGSIPLLLFTHKMAGNPSAMGHGAVFPEIHRLPGAQEQSASTHAQAHGLSG